MRDKQGKELHIKESVKPTPPPKVIKGNKDGPGKKNLSLRRREKT